MIIATKREFPANCINVLRFSSVLLVFVASACTSTPTPDQMSRTAVETAPADLQLLCANAAAQAGGVDSSKVLPMSSRKLDAKTYQVELTVGGKPISCTIDTEGNVISV